MYALVLKKDMCNGKQQEVMALQQLHSTKFRSISILYCISVVSLLQGLTNSTEQAFCYLSVSTISLIEKRALLDLLLSRQQPHLKEELQLEQTANNKPFISPNEPCTCH